MQFFLFKRDFPECGREIIIDDHEMLERSGFNAAHPTRIIIHGWMSQKKGTFNRGVKNAYLNLTKKQNTIEEKSNNNNSGSGSGYGSGGAVPEDFNIIAVDWSAISTNLNYFSVIELIEELGHLLAEFVRFLAMNAQLHYDDVYLIGHSLGAHIAGSAGKQVQPFMFNTIYALDPAGPKFRNLSADNRIDSTDAKYVESIQTSGTLGLREPIGHANFYPNFGSNQKKCYIYGCSHRRAHRYFAESITSSKGFWGTRCEQRQQSPSPSPSSSSSQSQSGDCLIIETNDLYRMGGEPSTPKNGTFYVRTHDKPPYAMGRRTTQLT